VHPHHNEADGRDAEPFDPIYLVPGQGASPYGALAHEFLARSRTVSDVLERVDATSQAAGYPAVSRLLLDRETSPDQPHGAEQLAHYAASVALHAVLVECGFRPHSIVAVSLGEFAALVAAGVYSVESGALAVCAMNDAYTEHPSPGGLAVVAADEAGAQSLIQRAASPDLVIAGINAPKQTLISGSHEAIGDLLALASQPGLPIIRRLPVPYLTHHPRLEPAARYVEAALRQLPTGPLGVPVYSVVRRRWYTEDDDLAREVPYAMTDAMHLREGLEQFSGDLSRRFIELGAGDTATRAARTVLRGALTVAPLARNTSWTAQVIEASAPLNQEGAA